MFSLDNLSIQYPHAEVERVPVSWLFIYAGAVPLGVLVAWALVVRPGTHKAHVTILGWFIRYEIWIAPVCQCLFGA